MKTTIDKAELKKQIIYNVKTLYRKTIDEATPQQVFQAVSYALKVISLISGLQLTRRLSALMQRRCIIFQWSF